MAYLNCPRCKRRLRVPDSLEPLELRCPACQHAFRSDGGEVEDDPGEALSEAARRAGSPETLDAAHSPEAAEESAFVASDVTTGRILSKADEAMLREYGSGTGLLELTRDAISAPDGAGEPAGSAFAPSEGAALSKEELDRQFQIIGTALALANKLVQAHRGELARTRRQSTLGWALVAAMTLAAGGLGWWAVSQSGQTNVERVQGAHLSQRLADANRERDEYKAQIPKLREELDAARAEHRTALSELASASKSLADSRESLATKKGEADTLAAELKGANARLAAASREVERLTEDLAAARAAALTPATSPSGVATRPAATRPAEANAAVAGPAPP